MNQLLWSSSVEVRDESGDHIFYLLGIESILVMYLLDEMVSFSKLLSFEEECHSGRHSMSVKHLYIARDVTRRFGIFAFSENLHIIILTTMVRNYIIFYHSRGTGSLKPYTGLQPACDLFHIMNLVNHG